MKFVNSAAFIMVCALSLLALPRPASAAMMYDWSLTGPAAALGGFPLTGSGTLTTGASSGSGFDVTAITGMVGGSAVTGLTSYFGSDDLAYPTGTTFVDTDGLAFTTASGTDVNVFSFFAQGSPPSGNAYGEFSSAGFGVGTFNLQPVPEPATLWLMAAGLLAMLGVGFVRRQKNSTAA